MKFVNVRELKNKTNEDELEDYVLMNHPDFLAQMVKSYQGAKAGRTTNIDAYLGSDAVPV